MALPSSSKVLSSLPTFVMSPQISLSLGLSFIGVPLQADTFDQVLPALLTAIAEHQPGIIFLAYPNNRTGTKRQPAKFNDVSVNFGLHLQESAWQWK